MPTRNTSDSSVPSESLLRGRACYERGEWNDAFESPGLYFVGLPFQYSMSSGMIQGVGRDAKRIVEEARRSLLVSARSPP